jgi:hypothetical protein
MHTNTSISRYPSMHGYIDGRLPRASQASPTHMSSASQASNSKGEHELWMMSFVLTAHDIFGNCHQLDRPPIDRSPLTTPEKVQSPAAWGSDNPGTRNEDSGAEVVGKAFTPLTASVCLAR